METFDTLVVITPQDFERLANQYRRLIDNLNFGRVIFVGKKEVKELMENAGLDGQAGFIDEDTIIPFEDVHRCVSERMASILVGRELPRKVTGWYYQQFLKMQYAFMCDNKYYMTWDGDTIPTCKFEMFKNEENIPYMDVKTEYHEEYFVTMSKLIPGMRKCIEKSFISEHMLFRTDIMKSLIERIMMNNEIEGKTFYEKIINAIEPEMIQSSSFSEFETYGSYVCLTEQTAYRLRKWHSFRLAGEFFDPNTITDRDYEWLSKDFTAISFEKGHTVRDDHKNLFDNPTYQEKLTARQMLEIAQEEFNGGYLEVWD